MGFVLKVGKRLLDLVEIYIPMFTFLILFMTFIIQIFFRYFLKSPLTWPYEVTVFTFIWTVMFSAAYVRRLGEHVSFSLVYDKAKPRIQTIYRIIGNIVISIGFMFALCPCYDFVMFNRIQTSTVLKIPFHIAFFPFIIFMILVIGHSIYDIVVDIRKLIERKI